MWSLNNWIWVALTVPIMALTPAETPLFEQ